MTNAAAAQSGTNLTKHSLGLTLVLQRLGAIDAHSFDGLMDQLANTGARCGKLDERNLNFCNCSPHPGQWLNG